MLYNVLIRSEGQIAAVSEHISIMTVPDFFNVDEQKEISQNNGGAIMPNTMTKNTFRLEVKVLVHQLC